jgi:anaerobic magnesium-protoporphyrin IX monomethyl ester cyclase
MTGTRSDSPVRGCDPARSIDAIFVNSPLKNYDVQPRRHNVTLPVLGLAYITTYCRARGLNVGVLDAEALGLGVTQIAAIVNEHNPRWVALNLLAPTYRHSVDILGRVAPEIQVMVGGHHAKAMPRVITEDPNLRRMDALIVGEAEYRAYEILNDTKRRETLPDVFWRDADGRMAGGHASPGESAYWLAPDAEQLPFVARDFLANDPFLASDGRVESSLVGSRGCPYDCSFCGAARSANPGVSIRTRSPGNILAEMELLMRTDGVTAFRFVDDLFLANPDFMSRCMALFQAHHMGQRIAWDATGRINVLCKASDELLDALAAGGCREIALGMESGSNRLLRYMDKSITAEMTRAAVARLTNRGIHVKGYFIFGYPTESENELRESIELIRYLWKHTNSMTGKFRCSVFEFRPYPGTPEWHRLLASGRYTAAELLLYEHIDLTERGSTEELLQRDEFNFSVNLQFSKVPVRRVRDLMRMVMIEQSQRSSARTTAAEDGASVVGASRVRGRAS